MFAQLKEEFIDVTMSMSISPSEFEKFKQWYLINRLSQN